MSNNRKELSIEEQLRTTSLQVLNSHPYIYKAIDVYNAYQQKKSHYFSKINRLTRKKNLCSNTNFSKYQETERVIHESYHGVGDGGGGGPYVAYENVGQCRYFCSVSQNFNFHCDRYFSLKRAFKYFCLANGMSPYEEFSTNKKIVHCIAFTKVDADILMEGYKPLKQSYFDKIIRHNKKMQIEYNNKMDQIRKKVEEKERKIKEMNKQNQIPINKNKNSDSDNDNSYDNYGNYGNYGNYDNSSNNSDSYT